MTEVTVRWLTHPKETTNDKHERTHVKNEKVFAETADQGRCAMRTGEGTEAGMGIVVAKRPQQGDSERTPTEDESVAAKKSETAQCISVTK